MAMTGEDSEGLVLPGGNLGGAVRVGATVRRPVGPWTPAVHALLRHLDGRVPDVPRVLGFDESGREVLTFLPGTVVPVQVEEQTLARVRSMASWTGLLHAAVAGFDHPGPWRMWPVPAPTLVGHNDVAAYNVAFDGDDVVGIFDWDLAGPTTPLLELGFLAWNAVPLHADVGADRAAEVLTVIADAYARTAPGLTPSPLQILHAVPVRIALMVEGIPVAAAAGDAGMARLIECGYHSQDVRSLSTLQHRLPSIARALA
jgi:hypothetical protein